MEVVWTKRLKFKVLDVILRNMDHDDDDHDEGFIFGLTVFLCFSRSSRAMRVHAHTSQLPSIIIRTQSSERRLLSPRAPVNLSRTSRPILCQCRISCPKSLDLRILEEQLDTAVDSEINIKLSRAGEVMNIQLRVDDFHKLLLDGFELHELHTKVL